MGSIPGSDHHRVLPFRRLALLGILSGLGACADAGPEPQRELNVAGVGSGSGGVSDATGAISCSIVAGVTGATGCSAELAEGSRIVLTAIPAAGSSFTGWSGTGVGCPGTGSCTVILDQSKAVTAAFLAPALRLSVSPQVVLLDVGGKDTLAVEARDAGNAVVPTPLLATLSRDTTIVSVVDTQLSAHLPGVSRVVVSGGGGADSAEVAVLAGSGFGVLVSDAPDRARLVAAGATLTLGVRLLRPPNGVGSLGSFQARLHWDPAVLTYRASQGVESGWSWLVNDTQAAGGILDFGGFSATGTAADIELGALQFDVAPGSAGAGTALSLDALVAGNSAGFDVSPLLLGITSHVAIP